MALTMSFCTLHSSVMHLSLMSIEHAWDSLDKRYNESLDSVRHHISCLTKGQGEVITHFIFRCSWTLIAMSRTSVANFASCTFIYIQDFP